MQAGRFSRQFQSCYEILQLLISINMPDMDPAGRELTHFPDHSLQPRLAVRGAVWNEEHRGGTWKEMREPVAPVFSRMEPLAFSVLSGNRINRGSAAPRRSCR